MEGASKGGAPSHAWFDALPHDWTVKPVRVALAEKDEKNESAKCVNYLSLVSGIGIIPYAEKGDVGNKKPDDLSKCKLVAEGDFVINSMNFLIGAFGRSPFNGICSPVYIVAEPNQQEFDPRFLMRVFQVREFQRHVGRLGNGILELRMAIGWHELKNQGIPAPPIAEQTRIANFLDEKTARIDALIGEKERLVERLLEYQYSHVSSLMILGINADAEFVGTSFPEIVSIPRKWTVKRLKFLGEVRSGVAKGKDIGGKAVICLPYLRVANVQDGYVDLTEVLEIEVAQGEAARYMLRKNDVLMNEGGDNDKLGRGTVWKGEIDHCIHQNHVFAVRLFDTSLSEWVARFTSVDAARMYFLLRSKQSTNLASINQSDVRELPVPIPPDEERRAILEEVKRSAQATTELSEHAQAHITLLREYRASLISAAVTGQLDIDNYGKGG